MTAATASPWRFYGRQAQLASLRKILERHRWFFLRVSGRRRIGKTTLVRHALEDAGNRKAIYIQVPDSDPAGVVTAAREHLRAFGIEPTQLDSLDALAREVMRLVRLGYTVLLDEFQYFHRRSLYEFTSFLQREIDQVLFERGSVKGSLIVLGSLHTEMVALLEERNAPLYGRLNHFLDVPHLEVGAVAQILREHSRPTPQQLLFLWTLFEGVPKFYRDAYDLGVLDSERRTLLDEMFFEGSAPLADEAESWFLRELHGRFDAILRFVAEHPGCSHADVVAHTRCLDTTSPQHVSVYLRSLTQRYGMVEHLQPALARRGTRTGRFYLRDNFLRAWVSALATPVSASRLRDRRDMVALADERIMQLEGHALERLVRALYAERSRAALGDFALTRALEGYWDRKDTEIDLVALNELDRQVRLGTCKRDADKLIASLEGFERHQASFLAARPDLRSWKLDRVAITVQHTRETRAACERKAFIPQDLEGLVAGL